MTTLNEMEELSAEIAELRLQESAASNAKKIITEKLTLAENKMIETLTANSMDSYRSKVGLLSLSERTSVRLPKSDDDRAQFFNWLKNMGLYDKLVTVNSQTLNALYKEKFEEAKSLGNSEFAIPGCNEITITETLSFRRV